MMEEKVQSWMGEGVEVVEVMVGIVAEAMVLARCWPDGCCFQRMTFCSLSFSIPFKNLRTSRHYSWLERGNHCHCSYLRHTKTCKRIHVVLRCYSSMMCA